MATTTADLFESCMNELWAENPSDNFVGFDDDFLNAKLVAERMGAKLTPWEPSPWPDKACLMATFLDGSYVFVSEDGLAFTHPVDESEEAGEALENF